MGCKIIYIFLLVFSLTFVSAELCQKDNDFQIGENITICTGNCTYRNPEKPEEWLNCDSSVSCKFTSFFPSPNDSVMVSYEPMNLHRGYLNYSFGTFDTNNLEGIYRAKIVCDREDGGKGEVEFEWSVSGNRTYSTSGSGVYVQSPREYAKQYVDESITNLKAGWKKQTIKYLIYGLLGVLALLFILDLRRNKIRKLAREVAKIQNKK